MEPMQSDRIHRATSDDGTEIAGRVFGEGPPLVLVHGGFGDGETSWRFLLPFMQDFTCYCPSLRSRGLSAEHPDHSIDRLVADVVRFVDSISGPVGLFGHSSGGLLSLLASQRSEQVAAVAAFEPGPFPQLVAEEIVQGFVDTIQRSTDAAADGRLADAALISFAGIALVNDEEMEVIRATNSAELVAPNIPPFLRDADGFLHLPTPDLEQVGVPVLLLEGTRTNPYFTDVIRQIAGRIPDASVRAVDGAGHMGPLLAAEPVAAELATFFTDVLTPA